ncbi:receptor-like protein 35 [Panicum hallii]|uniref:receptor-like protein 35 n=1 Tax=Panicum hallii TaxID=206008 RepID=UPI000DF4EC57|nr:receptor-like protein 35 [Panicum hallii]
MAPAPRPRGHACLRALPLVLALALACLLPPHAVAQQPATRRGAVVPDDIGGLAGLTVLDLSNTSVGGGFPAFLYNCTAIARVDLSHNRLTGELPADIGRLGGSLTYLALDHNNFTGAIPAALSKLTNLTYLALNGNKLTGTIPPELGELVNLQTIKLEGNLFGAGMLPESFMNLTKLTTVWLASCSLGGEFPTSLVQVDLSMNQLIGTIPESFGSLLQLELLNLQQNNLTGGIPPSIARLPSLVLLWLFSNNLTGVLPAELGKQTPLLRDIQVDDNKLSGPIPAGICDHHQLWVFTASGNRLNGSIPDSLATCRTLIWLQVGDNELSGEVPAALWTETKLIALLMQNSGQLTGTLPKELYWNLTTL